MAGLFSSGSSSSSYIKRPEYVQSMINSLSDQIGNQQTGDYTAEQFAGLNENQQNALASMLNSSQFQSYYDKLNQAGQAGISQLNSAYDQLNNLQPVTQGDINRTAEQLYDYTGTEDLINAKRQQLEQQQATEVNPNVAQQTMQESGFGSSQRLAKDRAAASLATETQNQASDITNQAYQNAQQEAASLLSGNLSNKRSILGALANNAQNQASYINTGAQMAQQQYQDQLAAVNQQQQNLQNQYNMQYQNQQLQQNWKYQNWQNQLNNAGALSDLYGQKVTTKTSGGSNILGGALSLAGGVVGGIYGGPAGAAIGSQLGGMAGSALAS